MYTCIVGITRTYEEESRESVPWESTVLWVGNHSTIIPLLYITLDHGVHPAFKTAQEPKKG